MKELKEKYNELSAKWGNVTAELKTCINKCLDKALESHDSCIEISSDVPCSVAYDGGNHPEYASNCFSSVNAIFKKDGHVYLDIEDCEEYDIDSLSINELMDVTESVLYTIEHENDEEEE